MGSYDSVMVICPSCGGTIEFQSKVGPCEFIAYDIGNAPASILGDLKDQGGVCESCGSRVKMIVQCLAIPIRY